MAVLIARSMVIIEGEQKGVHPYFGNQAKIMAPLSPSVLADQPLSSLPNETNSKERKGRGIGKATRYSQARRLLEIDFNYERRKRRKSTSQSSTTAENQFAEALVLATDEGHLDVLAKCKEITETCNEQADHNKEPGGILVKVNGRHPPANTGLANTVPISHDNTLSLSSRYSVDVAQSESDLRPKKVLLFNPKTGTIGSPPRKTPCMAKTLKGKISSNKGAHLVVKMKYGRDESLQLFIGQEIDDLFNGHRAVLGQRKTFTKSTKGAKAVLCAEIGPEEAKPLKKTEPKPTHPFFLGKTIPKFQVVGTAIESDTPVKAPPVKKGCTLGEAKSISPRKKSQPPVEPRIYNFGTSSKTIKFPGAVEPCWPPKDMLHIRGQGGNVLPWVSLNNPTMSMRKKSKYSALEPSAKEDVLGVVARKLDIDRVIYDLSQVDADAFTKPDKCLRIPERRFETGIDIQQRVRRELRTRFPSSITCTSSEDELQSDECERPIHPALMKAYELIASTLSAFDRSEYETQPWIHKYAPCSASEVLQMGREAFILKDWLQTLMVVSVDDGLRSWAASESRRSSKPAKRKRKSKLDGFIIPSDEEDDLDEISEPEDEPSQKSTKTVVRANHTGKQMNAVVISGPSGCGKTAMVYAVAKELDFEVFEINASSRRSGKDVLERVGDMTRNHLVHLSECRGGGDEEIQQFTDTLAAELKSGRQGTMSSFFKMKAKKQRDVEPLKQKQSKAQKQSLILLEEVDILFEEDKQFWATIMTLITQSKRPIIMTCNDEALVPLQALPLHAIIRLGPPPLELAVDYMLLVAATEGHIVHRRAVEALFDNRQLDLRASMTELDYWCQLGVGDRRGGFDWFYPRWPRGRDVDAEGNTIRVVSEGTYATGMGWLGRDFQYDGDSQSAQEELLREAWDSWHIDVDMTSTFGGSFALLSSYESYVDSLSLADLCAHGSLAKDYQTTLDVTVPPLSTRDDFAIGYELLQAETQTANDLLQKQMSSCIKLRARERVYLRTATVSEARIIERIADIGQEDESITRQDFSLAFDPIAKPEKPPLTGSSLEASVFDRTVTMIAVDLAPYVRSIVTYDAQLQAERSRLSNLLSEGGRGGKRLRTTRSSLLALEGRARRTARPERYFGAALNPHLVLRTGLQCWQDAVAAEARR